MEISNVNIGTIIHWVYMYSLKEELNARDRNPYTLDVMRPVKEKIK